MRTGAFFMTETKSGEAVMPFYTFEHNKNPFITNTKTMIGIKL